MPALRQFYLVAALRFVIFEAEKHGGAHFVPKGYVFSQSGSVRMAVEDFNQFVANDIDVGRDALWEAQRIGRRDMEGATGGGFVGDSVVGSNASPSEEVFALTDAFGESTNGKEDVLSNHDAAAVEGWGRMGCVGEVGEIRI